MKLKHVLFLSIAATASLSLTSCLDDDGGNNTELGTGYVSFVNATPDTPALDFYITAEPATLNFTERYPDESYLDAAAPNRYNFAVTLPDVTTSTLFESPLEINQDIYHSVFIYNRAEDMQGILLRDDLETPASGMAKVRFLHLAPDAPTVDLVVEGEPDADAWFSDYEFEDVEEEFIEVEAGTYNLDIRDSESGDIIFTEPAVMLDDSKTYTLWVGGLTDGTTYNVLGLQSIEHIEFTDNTTP